MTPQDLAAIREREEKTTPGPWVAKGFGSSDATVRATKEDWPTDPVAWCRANVSNAQNDADFIAHARSDVPALCDALEAAWTDRDEWADATMGANRRFEIAEARERATREECDSLRVLVRDLVEVASADGHTEACAFGPAPECTCGITATFRRAAEALGEKK